MSNEETSEREGQTPDELCTELCNDFTNVDITEDETEFFLQEALALNKRLKAELQRQSHPARSTSSSFNSVVSGPLSAKPSRHGGIGARTTLPPLHYSKQHKLYSTSSKSVASKKSSQKGRSLPCDRASLSAGSKTKQPPSTNSKPSRTSRSADNRPEWNERLPPSTNSKPSRTSRSADNRPEWNERFSY